MSEELTLLQKLMTSKPPTRRITPWPTSGASPTTSKPPTRRITEIGVSVVTMRTSKPPTRRITRGFYKSISAFQ